MSWFTKKHPDTSLDVALSQVAQAKKPVKLYDLEVVTDTETYRVSGVPENIVSSYMREWAQFGGLLERDGEPAIFIPARRIIEIKFKKHEEDEE